MSRFNATLYFCISFLLEKSCRTFPVFGPNLSECIKVVSNVLTGNAEGIYSNRRTAAIYVQTV